MIKTIRYMARVEAENLRNHLASPTSVAVISVTDPGKPVAAIDISIERILRVSFLDCGNEFNREGIGSLNMEQRNHIVDFIRLLHADEREYELVVHCNFGISRSCAIAKFAAVVTSSRVTNADFKGGARPGSKSLYESLVSTLTQREHIS